MATARSKPTAPGTAAGIPEEEQFAVGELAEGAREWLGASPHAVRGALYDVGDRRLTLGEAKRRIDEFLKRPIENDPGRGE